MKRLITAIPLAILASCSSNTIIEEANTIEIVYEKPDPAICKYISEIVGSQGNWLTGEFTSDKSLVQGARNELRNETFKLGGNLVYVQDASNTFFNNTAIGKAYLCSDREAPTLFSELERKFKKKDQFKNYCIKFRDSLNSEELEACNNVEPYMRDKYPSMF